MHTQVLVHTLQELEENVSSSSDIAYCSVLHLIMKSMGGILVF